MEKEIDKIYSYSWRDCWEICKHYINRPKLRNISLTWKLRDLLEIPERVVLEKFWVNFTIKTIRQDVLAYRHQKYFNLCWLYLECWKLYLMTKNLP